MSNLANQLVIAEQQDVAKGIRLLLATPLISARTAPEAFDLIRRRHGPIAKWFDYTCGWRLVVEPRFGYARLAKVTSEHDHTRPARRSRSGRTPFDRRRYTLLCVIAAELLAGPVTTIGFLADRVKYATATDPVLEVFDTAARSERMAYVDALRLLESYGVLDTVDGSAEAFVDSREAKVLYRVDTTLLLRLLSAPTGPSQLATSPDEVAHRWPELLAGLTRESRYGDGENSTSDVQRNLWLRHSICRRLFDEPVLYRRELSEEQRGYLASLTGRQVVQRAAERAGFVLEERAEGYLLVDPEAIATDRKFPDDSGTANVAGLLLLDTLVTSAPGLTVEQLRAEVTRLLARFPRWAKTYRGEDGTERLVHDALDALAAFRLVEHTGGRVHALPAAARYSVAEIRTSKENS
ncbi:TIGR02678 family protein [Saccharomonospora xinjiangensis]|uniref:TIGR02678 family protein n=1 Tax=Saccharomonospora xinjiangensis XJ-54 TaxID=882086 RepID=I0UWT2_9PSEU|nr:TIGR02678 family protein [Saccharomonospora xinjiangensis]EID52335.1 TIGR02678 family protein [Saccharomonospora xinjiangensis XJ-54]